MATEIILPELGENIESADVIGVLVSVGDTVEEDQPILEIETDKAAFEVPASSSGVVQEIHVKVGDKAAIGQVILTVDADSTSGSEAPAEETPPVVEAEQVPIEEPLPVPTTPSITDTPKPAAVVAAPTHSDAPRRSVPAAPSVRRFAREVGIDIAEVPGSGPAGRISLDDVKAYAQQIRTAPTVAAPAQAISVPELPDLSKWGEIEREEMSGVRRVTAERLSQAWAQIPHVTQFDKADITELEQLRKQYGARIEQAGGKLTITAILLKVITGALKVFPQFNASVDMANEEIVYKKYYHIGVAVDTERGLLVPVIRDVDRKSITELSVELGQIAEKARGRKITPDEMQGGTFTITNLGGIGGTYFTPIINSPEVAILGVSRGRKEPLWVEDQFEPRLMLPLSLSYDHRVVDGADGIRFLRWIVQALEEPFLIALGG